MISTKLMSMAILKFKCIFLILIRSGIHRSEMRDVNKENLSEKVHFTYKTGRKVRLGLQISRYENFFCKYRFPHTLPAHRMVGRGWKGPLWVI